MRGVKFGRQLQYDKYQIEAIMRKTHEGEGYGAIAKSLWMKNAKVQMIALRETYQIE